MKLIISPLMYGHVYHVSVYSKGREWTMWEQGYFTGDRED